MQDQWEAAYPGVIGTVSKNVTLAFGRDPEQGSYSALYAGLSDEIVQKDYNGAYFSDPVCQSLTLHINAHIPQGTLGKESAQGKDSNLATALFELSERMVKRIVGDDALQSWSA